MTRIKGPHHCLHRVVFDPGAHDVPDDFKGSVGLRAQRVGMRGGHPVPCERWHWGGGLPRVQGKLQPQAVRLFAVFPSVFSRETTPQADTQLAQISSPPANERAVLYSLKTNCDGQVASTVVVGRTWGEARVSGSHNKYVMA